MEKGEGETLLSGSLLVDKTHPRVEFRGRLDELDAIIVMIQAAEADNPALVEKLDELRDSVYEAMSCDVTERPCSPMVLWNLTSDELRERSHNPKKYFGLGHIMFHREMGRAAAALNLLRTKVREAELSACRAYADGAPFGASIVERMNRLSSAVYVLMYSCLPEGYSRTITFGPPKKEGDK